MRHSVALAACLGAFLLAGPASAHLVNFTSDPAGDKPNGWQSVDSSLISFTDTVGAGLSLSDFGVQSFGNGLLCRSDGDGSVLQMDFSAPMSSLSMWFGNDDPLFSSAGDLALLTLFSGPTQVGQVSVVMNRDDVMNQQVAYSGAAFDRATLGYVNPQLSPFTQGSFTGLQEVIDDIEFFEAGDPVVPEPGTVALLGLGLGALARRRRR